MRVYRADEGVRVAVARVLPKAAAHAVIRVTRSDSPLDDLVGRQLARTPRFDRLGQQKKHELVLKKAGDKAGVAYWPSIDDDTLKFRHVGSFCSTPLESLASSCKDPARAAIARAKIQKATCRFGPALKLGVETGSLTWQTSRDAANQADFAKANLMNLLQ